MKIKSIRIKNFRNISLACVEPCAKVNILFGQNAQGKTNFLESIYTLSHGRSFRTNDSSNLIFKDDPDVSAAWVEIEIEKNSLENNFKYIQAEKEKKITLNEKKVSKSTILREFSTVLFSPESLSVIKNSDKERRDLIDELISTVYLQQTKTIDEYKKLLRQRNCLLKEFRDKKLEINPKNVLYLETLTERFLQTGAELVVMRMEALQNILPHLQQTLRTVFEEKNVDIDVDYVISDTKYRQITKEEALDAMYKRWLQLKSAEIKLGHSLVGPHKHDICLLFDGKDSRYFCSQGQQRLIILAFKIAQIRLHYDVHSTYPILLLDDVLSEIDEQKRIKLMEYLESIRAQIFITTTENTVLNYLSRKDFFVYEVTNGLIHLRLNHQEELSV